MSWAEVKTLFEIELDDLRDVIDVKRRWEAAKDDIWRAGGAVWGSPLPDLAEELQGRLELRRVFGNGDEIADIVRRTVRPPE